MSRKPGRLFDGPEGETLFHQHILELPPGEQEVPELLKTAAEAHDDRLYAVVSALVVENRLDSLLSLFLPGYIALSNNRDFTLSMRIGLLKAAKIIPSHIVTCADLVRSVRNDFAHNFELRTYNDLPKKQRDRIEAMNSYVDPPAYVAMRTTLRKRFEFVVFIAVVGLDIYQFAVRLHGSAARSPQFVQALRDKNKRDQDAFVEAHVALAKARQDTGGQSEAE